MTTRLTLRLPQRPMTDSALLEEAWTPDVVPQQTDNGPKPGDGTIENQGDVVLPSESPNLLASGSPNQRHATGVTARQVLAAAAKCLGTIGSPVGSNRQPFGAAYGMNAVAWCNIFVSEVGHQATGDYDLLGKFAYTPSCAKWWNGRGRFGRTPKAGAVAFFDWGGSKNIQAIDHVGIVVQRLANGQVRTIEGNAAVRGHTDGVWYHDRNPAYIVGYGYPAYVAPVPDPMPPFPGEARRGCKGAAVRQVQQRLAARGWHLQVDGDFGPATDKIVRAFQKDKGLQVDGVVGPVTWTALWRAPVT